MSQTAVSSHRKIQRIRAEVCPEINRTCFFAEIDTEVRDWLFELQDDQRLNVAFKAFKAIDQQMQIGADVREVVGQVLREIRNDFGNVKDNMSSAVNDVKQTMDKSVKDYLTEVVEQTKKEREETGKFVKESVEQQTAFLSRKSRIAFKTG